jgi:hypothetical protein
LAGPKEKVDALMCAELGTDPAHWTWHDIRRSVVTGMNEIGIEPHIIEAVVNDISGHKSGIAGVYNRATYAEQRVAALQAWGNHIDRLLGRGADNVTPLRRSAWKVSSC